MTSRPWPKTIGCASLADGSITDRHRCTNQMRCSTHSSVPSGPTAMWSVCARLRPHRPVPPPRRERSGRRCRTRHTCAVGVERDPLIRVLRQPKPLTVGKREHSAPGHRRVAPRRTTTAAWLAGKQEAWMGGAPRMGRIPQYLGSMSSLDYQLMRWYSLLPACLLVPVRARPHPLAPQRPTPNLARSSRSVRWPST